MFYWKRRRERRVMLLLFVGALGTIVSIPFARDVDGFVETVNDISEACCVLTFLLQITIIGYDLNKKFKMRSIMYLTYVAEVLIVADLVSILISCAMLFDRGVMSESTGQDIQNVAENANLAFIFFFRFYYVGISRGWKSIWETRKVEVCCYLLFATHEMPFDLVSSASGLNWEFAQAIWHRVTLTLCLFITAHGKAKQQSTVVKSVYTNRSSVNSDKDLGRGLKQVSSRYLVDAKKSPGLDFVRKSIGRSGGRRSSGPQICVVAVKKLPEE
ncbi:hypothetical protein PHMEG_00014571 [Phytophthora megakarya]|uniref:Uncharacterized protein n=1 Tax=Phytophthora megakarya TaxID=4795 RepID=A0A225W3G0_9STRA|nr:hypothetical protein PHMEG_00014571 [Phytophthora megakarya]